MLEPKSPPRPAQGARVRCGPGLTADDAEELRDTLLQAARNQDAAATDSDQYGQRYVVDFTMQSGDRQAVVRSTWIIRAGEDFPRLTSSFVL